MSPDLNAELDSHVLALVRPQTQGIACNALCARLKENTGRDFSPARVFFSLNRLEKQNLITSRWSSTETPGHGSRRHRIYLGANPQ